MRVAGLITERVVNSRIHLLEQSQCVDGLSRPPKLSEPLPDSLGIGRVHNLNKRRKLQRRFKIIRKWILCRLLLNTKVEGVGAEVSYEQDAINHQLRGS